MVKSVVEIVVKSVVESVVGTKVEIVVKIYSREIEGECSEEKRVDSSEGLV